MDWRLMLLLLAVPWTMGMDGEWLAPIQTLTTALAAYLGSHNNAKRIERKLEAHQQHDDARFDALEKRTTP